LSNDAARSEFGGDLAGTKSRAMVGDGNHVKPRGGECV
jgi:hypothetical protein